MTNQRFDLFISASNRLVRVLVHSFKVQPYYFVIVTLVRSAIRLLYFSAAILPFKVLLVLSRESSIPSFLSPYFSSNASLAYALCIFIGVAMILAMLLDKWVEYITDFKTRVILAGEFSNMPRRRNKLNQFIRKSTDVSSSSIILGLSMVLLFVIQYQVALVVVVCSIICLAITLLCRGELDAYIASSPMKFSENCLIGITLFSFFTLVQISILSETPPPFLSLIVCLVLIRQFSISVEKIVAVGLFFNGRNDKVVERVFTRL